MTGVHRLQHVERLAAPAFTHDDAIGPHAQRILDQIPDGDGPAPLGIGGPRFQRHQVRMHQLQLGRILDRDQPLTHRNQVRQHVQQCGLARACAARDDDALVLLHTDAQEFHHRRRGALVGHQRIGRHHRAVEAPDGDGGPFQRHRRNDGVDPRTIGQTRIHQRRGLIDAPAQRRHDALDHVADGVIVRERQRHLLQLALALHKDVGGTVDHDLADQRVGHQPLQRPQAHGLIHAVLHQHVPVDVGRQVLHTGHDPLHRRTHLGLHLVGRELGEVAAPQIDHLQQLPLHQAPPAQRLALLLSSPRIVGQTDVVDAVVGTARAGIGSIAHGHDLAAVPDASTAGRFTFLISATCSASDGVGALTGIAVFTRISVFPLIAAVTSYMAAHIARARGTAMPVQDAVSTATIFYRLPCIVHRRGQGSS